MAHKWDDTKRTSDVEIEQNISFEKMMLSDRVLLGLKNNGFTHPSPIQLRAIPLGVSGLDLLLRAKSGTGKTLVFATIVLECFQKSVKAPQSLIVTPTRELAVQIEEILRLIGAESSGFRVGSFIGGIDVLDDRKKVQKCKSIVGTPGRIVHLIKNNVLNISDIRILVLDEIDKLMTGTFPEDIDFIFKSLPKKQQVIGSSATFDKALETRMRQYMKNPIGVTPKKEAPVLLGVKQFVHVLEGESLKPMQEMFTKVKAIASVLSSVPFKQCLVFSNSQQRAESYSNYLTNEGWPCEVIMGSQEQSVRLNIFKKFKEFKCRILVATDLMARGVDSENVNLVINLEVPNDNALYLHRIGRCGRFGTHGIAITLVHTDDELVKFRKLLGSIGGSGMKVLKFPTKDSSKIWNFGDREEYARNYGEICGIADESPKGEVKKTKTSQVSIESQTIDTNLDLLEISKLLIDNPENNNPPPLDEDLFESYSMVVNCSNTSDRDEIPISAIQTNPVDSNRQFIDAISRLNLYSDEPVHNNPTHQTKPSEDENETNNNSNSELNSNTDGSNIGSDKSLESSMEAKSYETESETDQSDECSCSYRQSDSEDELCNVGCKDVPPCDDDISNIHLDNRTKDTIDGKWNFLFMQQISFIKNYVQNSKNMNRSDILN